MPHDTASRLGVCSWSLQPAGPAELTRDLATLRLPRLQLALDPIRRDPDAWAPLAEQLDGLGVTLASAQFGAIGEDYTTPQTIRQTGGFIPTEHWENNLANVRANVAIARRLGVATISTHAGFIPTDPADPMFDALSQRIRTLADLIADELGGALLLETGQETAATLTGFLAAVDRPNLGVNFDPANMILYDMGDPLDAVQQLLPHVRQVHLKDAVPPASPGEWGTEVPVGEGAVDWPAFLGTLVSGGYTGDWIIEREAGSQRVDDVATARDFVLQTLS